MKFLEFNSIFVIESLKTGEKKTGSELFNDIIRRGLLLMDMEQNCHLYTVESKVELLSVLEKIEQNIIYNFVNPIIHFETHGSPDGIWLSNDEVVNWNELQKIFIKLNLLSENNLFITMATCYGGYIYKAISPRDRAPFWGFVGAFEEVYPDEILFNFSSFYEEFLKSLDFNKAQEALNNSITPTSAISKFKFQNTSDGFQKAYDNYEKKYLNPTVFEQRLNILACQAMSYKEFKGWSIEKTKAYLKNIMIDKQKELKENMMSNFFSWDCFPNQKPKA